MKSAAENREKLRRIPALDANNLFIHKIQCKICGSGSIFFDRVDFNKYCNIDNFYEFGLSGVEVDYFRCMACGFLFTPNFDDWSPDDFEALIYNEDYIKVDKEYVDVRPKHVAKDFARRLARAEGARILDYGSGAGVFVSRMRELGFHNIECYDPFSSPSRPEGRFDIITCFEVIEHTVDPRGTLADIISLLKPDGCVILSQTLQPDDILSVRGAWWYLAPRNGHVSTYTAETLETLGRRRGLFFYNGDTVYGFAGPKPGAYARIALNSIGRAFSTVRLYAPAVVRESAIMDPATRAVLWYRTETRDRRQFRWTGGTRLEWQATWPEVETLQVYLPIVSQVSPEFAKQCSFEFDGVKHPARLAYGGLVAEFALRGKTSGRIALITPQPPNTAVEGGRATGLAVATAEDAVWGSETEASSDAGREAATPDPMMESYGAGSYGDGLRSIIVP